MAGLKQIKRRLVSVKNTRQITRAMKLVSAAKLNRAQSAVTRSREYSDALRQMLTKLLATVDTAEISHPLMERRSEIKRVRLLIVGGSRGLCGAYNTGVNKEVERLYRELAAKGLSIDSVLVGRKVGEHYRRVRREYLKSYETLSENPNDWPIDEISSALEMAYVDDEIDQVYLIYTKFLSAISQRVMSEQILPFDLSEGNSAESRSVQKGISADEISSSGITIFEPSAGDLFSSLIPRLIRVQIRQACLESKASEHASRMTAMDSATKNAGDLIDKLQLKRNRLRQSGITGELLDIVGGAEALN